MSNLFVEQLLASAQAELQLALSSNSNHDSQSVAAAISDAQRLINYANQQLEQNNE